MPRGSEVGHSLRDIVLDGDPAPPSKKEHSSRFSANPCTIKFDFTGSIARSARRRYLIYSEADFEVFRPAGATHCTDGGEILHSSVPNFTPIGATVRVENPQN